MEKVITIPKEFVKMGELVVIPRQEYDEYLRLKKIIPFVGVSASEKKAIREGRKEIKSGRFLTIQQIRNELEL